MPHSLYLGSGIVQPRLLDYDIKNGHHIQTPSSRSSTDQSTKHYLPSLSAINFCLTYSIIELALSLFTFALFVNSAILIVAGASLYPETAGDTADLFSIYALLSSSISKGAATIFALALLLSGISAGIVCTIAGQMVSEGALNWSISPWLRRLLTRSVSITPSIIIAGAVGAEGLSAALNGSQVALSVVLPFVSAPILYFTARDKFMTVRSGRDMSTIEEDEYEGEMMRRVNTVLNDVGDFAEEGQRRTSNSQLEGDGTKMANSWLVTGLGAVVWFVIAAMNVANLVLVGLGKGA